MSEERKDIVEETIIDKAKETQKAIENGVVSGQKRIEGTVVGGYKRIEEGVVGGYKRIEDGVVEGFNKITDKFVGKFLTREGETVEEARRRLEQSVQAGQLEQKDGE